MATENELVSTIVPKKISDYTDYHKDEQGQTIADVSYFESDAVIPLSGKYSASDENPTTKSVKLSEVIGGGVSVVSGGGIEQVSNGSIQLKDIDNAVTGTVPTKSNSGISWEQPFSLPTMAEKVGKALTVHNNSGTLSAEWEDKVSSITAGNGIDPNALGTGACTVAVKLAESDSGLEFNNDNYDHGLKVSNPVPAPSANHADVGKVLTVKTNQTTQADEVVWGDAPSGDVTLKPSGGLAKDNAGIYVDTGLGLYKTNSGKLEIQNTEPAEDGQVLTYHYKNDTESVVWEYPLPNDGHEGDILSIDENVKPTWVSDKLVPVTNYNDFGKVLTAVDAGRSVFGIGWVDAPKELPNNPTAWTPPSGTAHNPPNDGDQWQLVLTCNVVTNSNDKPERVYSLNWVPIVPVAPPQS